MSPVVFDPGQASVTRWIVDSIERALLGVTVANGAAHTFAVRLGFDRVRVPDADSADPDPQLNAPGRVIGEAEADRRGYAVCEVGVGADAIERPLSDPDQRYETPIEIAIKLPPESTWPARSRAMDIIDRVCNDCVRAVMFDPRRTVAGKPLAYNTICESSHEPMADVETGDLAAALCVFTAPHRRSQKDPQQGAPAGMALLGEPIDAFGVWGDAGTFDAETIASDDGIVTLTLTPTGGAPAATTIELAALTVQQLHDQLGAIAGVTAGSPAINAAVASIPARDLLAFSSTDILTQPNAHALVVEA